MKIEYSGNGSIRVSLYVIPVRYKIIIGEKSESDKPSLAISISVLTDDQKSLIALINNGGKRIPLLIENNKEVGILTKSFDLSSKTLSAAFWVGESASLI